MKIRQRDVKLKEYRVSKNKYNELKYFCMQYWEKKENAGSSPSCKKDVELIEQTVSEVTGELGEYILLNVTKGIPYEYMDVPCGRRQFYELRRSFFIMLAQKR